jgi:DNA-binding protein HU-beta
MVATAKDQSYTDDSADAAVIETAVPFLREAKHFWAEVQDRPVSGDEFLSAYRQLSAHATRFREYVMGHEEAVSESLLSELTVASAELDGLLTAYFHGHGHHDPGWRREADERLRQLTKSQSRIEGRLSSLARRELVAAPTSRHARGAVGRADLEEQVAEKAGLTNAQAVRAVDAILNTISDALARGEEVRLTGFGNFVVTQTSARTGRNPRTRESIKIPAGKRPAFRPGSRLKSAITGAN